GEDADPARARAARRRLCDRPGGRRRLDRGGRRMSAALVTIILAAGLAIVVVRRRSFAIALLAVQSLALGVGALEPAGDRSGEAVVAGVVLLTKAIVIPALLLLVVRRTREARLVVPVASAGARLACAGVLALAAVALVPPL